MKLDDFKVRLYCGKRFAVLNVALAKEDICRGHKEAGPHGRIYPSSHQKHHQDRPWASPQYSGDLNLQRLG